MKDDIFQEWEQVLNGEIELLKSKKSRIRIELDTIRRRKKKGQISYESFLELEEREKELKNEYIHLDFFLVNMQEDDLTFFVDENFNNYLFNASILKHSFNGSKTEVNYKTKEELNEEYAQNISKLTKLYKDGVITKVDYDQIKERLIIDFAIFIKHAPYQKREEHHEEKEDDYNIENELSNIQVDVESFFNKENDENFLAPYKHELHEIKTGIHKFLENNQDFGRDIENEDSHDELKVDDITTDQIIENILNSVDMEDVFNSDNTFATKADDVLQYSEYFNEDNAYITDYNINEEELYFFMSELVKLNPDIEFELVSRTVPYQITLDRDLSLVSMPDFYNVGIDEDGLICHFSFDNTKVVNNKKLYRFNNEKVR